MKENDKNRLLGAIVLLITDDPVSSYMLPTQMEYSGVLMIDTASADNAIELLSMHTDIKMVLVDLPLIDALEAVAKIRAKHDFDLLPVIVLGNHEMKEYHLACIATGANDYAVKSLDVNPLMGLMNHHMFLTELCQEDAPTDEYEFQFKAGQVVLMTHKH
jgi:CheY-like chemotaxis protein